MARGYARLLVAAPSSDRHLWIAAAVAATLYLPSFDSAQSVRLRGLVPRHADAIAAQVRSARLVGLALVPGAAIVQRNLKPLGRKNRLTSNEVK
jgi:hypothetical protein